MAKKSPLRLAVFAAEVIFIQVVPIYLYGWLVGLLVSSALTSLLHIIILLEKVCLLLENKRG